jgi:hypothetical protein
MNIKKILFPFSVKESDLKNRWWHRLSVVIFYILLSIALVLVFLKLNSDELKSRSDCLSFIKSPNLYTVQYESVTQQQMALENNKSSYGTDYYNAEKNRLQQDWDGITKEAEQRIDDCLSSNPIHNKLNISLALLSTILLWYLLQVIYCKVLLYVVLGNNKIVKK